MQTALATSPFTEDGYESGYNRCLRGTKLYWGGCRGGCGGGWHCEGAASRICHCNWGRGGATGRGGEEPRETRGRGCGELEQGGGGWLGGGGGWGWGGGSRWCIGVCVRGGGGGGGRRGRRCCCREEPWQVLYDSWTATAVKVNTEHPLIRGHSGSDFGWIDFLHDGGGSPDPQ